MGRSFKGRLRAADQDGFTLIETMYTAVLLVVVLGASLSLTEGAQRVVPKDEERALTLHDSQVALSGMTEELRQAYTLNSTTATGMDVSVRIRGVNRRVVFDCNEPHPSVAGLKQCVRYLITGGVPGPKSTIVPRVSSAAFTYEPVGVTPPKFVRLTLKVPAAGERTDGYTHKVFLDDGFYMRNLDNG